MSTPLSQAVPITICSDKSGNLVLENAAWPDVTVFHRGLLSPHWCGSGTLFTVADRENEVLVRVANGEARYRLEPSGEDLLIGHLLSSSLTPKEAP